MAVPPSDARSRRLRILRSAALLVVALALAAFLWVGLAFARVAAGYAATITALHVFGAGDSLERVERERLRLPFELERGLHLELDEEHRLARATAFGVVTREAVWRAGLGATRRIDGSPLADEPAPAPVPPRPADLPWPAGESGELCALTERTRARLERAVGAAFETPEGRAIPTHAVVVAGRDGLLAERYAPGTDAAKPLLGWSMTKSVTATLVARLIVLGRASGVEEPLRAPEWSAPDDPRREITVEHCLRMTNGLAFSADYVLPWSDSLQMLFVRGDAPAYAADRPPVHAPGTVWSYSDGSTNLVARWIEARAGGTRAERLAFPREALFEPLGMSTAVLSLDPAGHWVGSSLMQASARDWARLGLLHLQDGVWEGRRLLPEGWVSFVARATEQSDARCYGAGLWRYDPELLRDGDGRPVPPELGGILYFAGHDQQYTWIDRARGLVVVRLGMRDERFVPAAFVSGIVRVLADED